MPGSKPSPDPVAARPLGAADDRAVAQSSLVMKVQDLVVEVNLGPRAIPAVDGVSFDIFAGETLGLVGESGSGKSLTALALLRLLAEPQVRIAGGRIDWKGRDLAALDDRQMSRLRGRELAMVFQEPSTALNPVFPVGAQVGEPLRIHQGLDRRAAFEKAVELLELVGIPEPRQRAHAYPHQLSGGMKQRAIIAMALACRPALLVADEPTTALDVTVQAQILTLLRRLQREFGMALLLITHDLGVVAETCERVAVMYGGRIVETGPAVRVLDQPRHPYTVGLLTSMRTLEAGGTGGASAGRLREIPGTVPPLGAFPPGCAFADRCDRVQPKCRSERPALESMGDGAQQARCFFPVSGP